MKKISRIFVVIALSFMMFGCGAMNTVKKMPVDVDMRIKNLQPPPGKALVYVVRPGGVGKPFGADITANDTYIGRTQGYMYIYAALPPGEYKFKVTGHDNDVELDLNLEADKTYYLYQGVYPGLMKGVTKLISYENVDQARKELMTCSLGDKLGEYTVKLPKLTKKGVKKGKIDSSVGIYDESTGLNWLNIPLNMMPQKEATTYCEYLEHEGYSDWRLPDKDELKTLFPIKDQFTNYPSSKYFWSSTRNEEYGDYFWGMYVEGGEMFDDGPKDDDYHVICLRGGN